jgi:uncharacterized damage-inducible protein DinB
MRSITKPSPGEYPAYAAMYVDLLPGDGQVLAHLGHGGRVVQSLFGSLSDDRLAYRYAPGKWTPKEILLHVTDDERIYAYRALRFARGDSTELPGFEQEPYAASSHADTRSVPSLLEEHAAVRRATLTLFDNLPEEALVRRGIANGAGVTVRALAYHIAGHELHHLAILRERYGISVPC